MRLNFSPLEAGCEGGEICRSLLGDLRRRLLWTQTLWVRENRAEHFQRWDRARFSRLRPDQIRKAELVDLLRGAREVGVHLEAVEVTYDQ
jgi:hypothetical protein